MSYLEGTDFSHERLKLIYYKGWQDDTHAKYRKPIPYGGKKLMDAAKIDIIKTQDNDDGTCTVTIDCNKAATELLVNYAFVTLCKEMIDGQE